MLVDRRKFLQCAAIALGGSLSAACRDAVLNHDPEQPLRVATSALTDDQVSSISALVDRIIPATSTPGATDVGVHEFVEFMLTEGYGESQVEIFLDGLTRLNDLATEATGSRFSAASPEVQDSILSAIEAEELAAAGSSFAALFAADQDRPFFSLAKELTIVGYFTSEQVATNQFSFSHAAGYFDGCVDLDSGQKPWYGGL